MSLLDHPEAQALLADAVLTPEAVRGCRDRLTRFLQRYLPCFYRAEQRANAALVIRGLLSGLQLKTCEPIAVGAGVHRKPIQFLVGAGEWDDEAVVAELRHLVAEELADERAVIVIDESTFPKSGDDEFGRPAHFRAWLRREHERYVLDLPCDTVVRDLECRRPPRRRKGRGARRQVPYRRVDAWAARQPASRWARLTVRDGERGSLLVDAMAVPVRTKLDRKNGRAERLVVMRTVEDEPRTHYALSNAAAEVPLEELVRVRFTRHKVEEVFEAAEQEAGLAHYEVRSWVG